jgi:very-short-patch-repair endonuclease
MKRKLLAAGTVPRSRALRRSTTDAEKRLWRALREKLPEAKFRRQVPLGPYFADFVSHSAKLVIEVDGGQHAEQEAQDARRTAFLNGEGYRVIRFWNNEVMEQLEGVLSVIAAALPPHPPTASRRAPPSPTRGEGFALNSTDFLPE